MFHVVFADAQVKGNISVNVKEPAAIFSENASLLYPGEVIELSIRGKLNLNPKPRSKRKCKNTLGINHSCRKIKWTENHWIDFGKNIKVDLALILDKSPIRNFETTSEKRTLIIPLQSKDLSQFHKEIRLHGYVKSSDPYPNINRSTSIGSLQISMVVNSNDRVKHLPSFLEYQKGNGLSGKEIIRAINSRLLETQYAEDIANAMLEFYENNSDNAHIKKEFGIVFKFLRKNLPPTSKSGRITNHLSDFYLDNLDFNSVKNLSEDLIEKYKNKALWPSLPEADKADLAKAYKNLGIAYSEDLMLTNKGDLVAADLYLADSQALYEMLGNSAEKNEVIKRRTKALKRIRTHVALEQAKGILFNQLGI